MELERVRDIAARCTLFGMCKIDFLGTGVCPAGSERKYLSYYPQGRMQIACALSDNLIPVTERLVDIVESCSLCGICDKQCYFLTELRPIKVMHALKICVEEHLARNGLLAVPEEDETIRALRTVVDSEWASNDPAVLAAYSKARSALLTRRMPQYVVLPRSVEQVSMIVGIANERNLEYVARGSGTSSAGALTDGIVIDLIRMSEIEIDRQNWNANVGAGVTAFELQMEAQKHSLRANVAEPAACVCANIISTNLHSLFSYAYGMGADHCIDAEFVDRDAKVFRLNHWRSPNLFAFTRRSANSPRTSPGICTGMTLKLHPTTDDEQGIVIPYSDFHQCAAMAREMCKRRIGLAAGILGTEYLSVFSSPTSEVAEDVERVLRNDLGIEYVLLVLADEFDARTLREMSDAVLDQDLFAKLVLSLPNLSRNRELELLVETSQSEHLYERLFAEDLRPIVEMSLSSSTDYIVNAVHDDMKEFFRDLYSRPSMTNLVWLNMYRILSARMGRNHMFAPCILWCPLSDPGVMTKICSTLRQIGDEQGLKSAFGYLVPVDLGKRAIMEYDYYFDHTDERELEKARSVLRESKRELNEFVDDTGIILGDLVIGQGLSRPESYLYG